MSEQQPQGPDLTNGVAQSDLEDNRLLGHVGGQQVLLVRASDTIFAIDALCTHYHGPLAEGLITGDSIRCPWHHACFSLRSGEALHAPAIAPLSTWKVENKGDRIFVREKLPAEKRSAKGSTPAPQRIVIVGGGAAGFGAAEMLRREAFSGEIVMLSNDSDAPVDRPNLSKDYLAGTAPEEWVPLQPDSSYADNKIDLRLKTDAVSIDTGGRRVVTATGATVAYDRLLLATGAEPVRLNMPGAQQPNVHTFTPCGALLTLARSLPQPKARAAPLSSAPASLALKRRRPCARAASRCTS
jgi:nitrite reductase/ring-hydroxylating ferredoxin subunit